MNISETIGYRQLSLIFTLARDHRNLLIRLLQFQITLAHLIDCGVFDDSIADVMKLRSRGTRASSFCVSLCNTEVESMIYVSSKWPECICT